MMLFKRRVVHRFSVLVVAIVFLSTAGSHLLSAAILFESGTLGPTGVTWQQAIDGEVPAIGVSSTVFTGVRFQLSQPVVTSQIGGHFFAPSSGTFFGAIVELDDENDFPDSGDFLSSDVLGDTLLTFPVPSDEVFGDLVLSLDPGWYALVFGSGFFEATTNGGAVGNNPDIGSPTYIAFQPDSGFGWVNITSVPNQRFVVKGQVVPEASSIVLASMASLLLFNYRKFYRMQNLV